MTTRRTFLTQAAAGAVALSFPTSLRRLRSSLTAAECLPAIDEEELRTFAVAAVATARAAGATYADVRVSAGQFLGISTGWSTQSGSPLLPIMSPPGLRFGTGVGVRALVDGAWGFSGSDIVTAATVEACARAAVGFARGNRRRSEASVVLARVGASGRAEWATPIARDPFTVSIAEQGELQLDAIAGALRLKGLESGSVGFNWRRRIQVFASTEGALLTQRFVHALPGGVFIARTRSSSGAWGSGSAQVDELQSGGYGWEAVHASTLPRLLHAAAERAVDEARRWAVEPKSAEVGRYDVVLSAAAVGALVGETLGQALDLERALGFRANRQGTSFAAPPLDMLGQYHVASPLVTLRADRTTRDGAATVAWDDEGTPAMSTTLIERGVITDYLTSRETAPELAPWYGRRRQSVRSNAACRGAGPLAPVVCLPNLTLEAARPGPSVEELIATTARGFYVEQVGGGGDQQLFSNQFGVGPGAVREIRRGKLGAPVNDFAVQFLTPTFWRNLEALGSETGARAGLALADSRVDAADPLHFPYSTIRGVPARFRQVNVLNVGRTA